MSMDAMWRRRLTLVCVVSIGPTACGFQPVPVAAQAGTTIVLPLSGEWLDGTRQAYESEVTREYGLYDDQRGELVFSLIDPADEGAPEHALVNRLITRVYPDPASRAGRQSGTTNGEMSQLLALIDVPASVPAGSYELVVRRRRRLDPDNASYEWLPSGFAALRELEVLAAELDPITGDPIEKFTPNRSIAGMHAGFGLVELYPNPKLVVRFRGAPPSAARLVVSYPTNRIRVLDVVEDLHSSSGSLVRFSNSDPPGSLTIHLVDPDASTWGVAIVFNPIDPFGAGRAEVDDFVVTDQRFYGPSGDPVSWIAAVADQIR